MNVLKFGGTSIGTPARMQSLYPLIHKDTSDKKILVLSAISGVTNDLESIVKCLTLKNKALAKKKIKVLQQEHENYAKELLPESKTAWYKIQALFEDLYAYTELNFQQKHIGSVLAFGELLSTTLLHYYLLEKEIQSKLLYAPDIIRTDVNKQPDIQQTKKNLLPLLSEDASQDIFIIQGFICTNSLGEVDNLQRGGSDYTASIIGAALDADEIQIWTDIDGFHNNDPRFVSNTQPIQQLCFDEAAELAYFGAKILHPQSIHPAKKYNIPVRLLDTSAPDLEGTRIVSEKKKQNKIVAIAAKDGITAIRIQSTRMLMAYGFLRKVFEVFEKYKTPIDMITTSEVAVSVTIDATENLQALLNNLKAFGSVEVDKNQSIVCVVGDFSDPMHGQATVVSEALKHLPVRMISYGGSAHNISMLLPEEYKIEALRSLHSRFF